jgi:hypothetical protein
MSQNTKTHTITSMRSIHILAIFILSAFSSFAGEEERKQLDLAEYKKGVESAVADLSKKKVRYDLVGQPTAIDQKLKKKAKVDFGIEVILHGCRRPTREDFYEGYKNTVLAYLKKKYGYDPIPIAEKNLRAEK